MYGGTRIAYTAPLPDWVQLWCASTLGSTNSSRKHGNSFTGEVRYLLAQPEGSAALWGCPEAAQTSKGTAKPAYAQRSSDPPASRRPAPHARATSGGLESRAEREVKPLRAPRCREGASSFPPPQTSAAQSASATTRSCSRSGRGK